MNTYRNGLEGSGDVARKHAELHGAGRDLHVDRNGVLQAARCVETTRKLVSSEQGSRSAVFQSGGAKAENASGERSNSVLVVLPGNLVGIATSHPPPSRTVRIRIEETDHVQVTRAGGACMVARRTMT